MLFEQQHCLLVLRSLCKNFTATGSKAEKPKFPWKHLDTTIMPEEKTMWEGADPGRRNHFLSVYMRSLIAAQICQFIHTVGAASSLPTGIFTISFAAGITNRHRYGWACTPSLEHVQSFAQSTNRKKAKHGENENIFGQLFCITMRLLTLMGLKRET